MQRYHGPSCTSAVNSSIGGASARDTRPDSSSLSGNYPVNSRRSTTPLTAYKLKCEKDSLSSRLGPPDFHPQSPNCPEETLTREYAQSGYKETFEGLEEAREISLTQVQAFTKPVVTKCKEAIKKCHRAINDSRAQKRKAGQVYGVPLSGSLVCKPGYPEQKPCGEETRRKWIEGLSQQHKRLRALADHVPHGYRRKSLFEVLIRNDVPLLRATWFIKVAYLNQVRPGSTALSSGTPDKTQSSRTELWTKDVIEYLQHLLDEFSSRNNPISASHSRDRSTQMLYAGSAQQRLNAASPALDGEEPSLHFKWWYMVRLLQWHHAEGLLLSSLIIDWVLGQLQDKQTFEILQLLLPLIYGFLETIVLSQTYVGNLVGVAVRFIQEPSPGGSDLVDNSRRAYSVSALIEMVRYLILRVPDTFVALDFFPLPSCITTYGLNDGSFTSKASADSGKLIHNSAEISSGLQGRLNHTRYESLSVVHVISAIQRSADELAKSASPGYPRHNVAKAVQTLDKVLSDGDISVAYRHLFEDLCDGAVDETWISDVSPCLRSSLKWIGSVSSSFICSVFFLCEWATSDFRDFRTVAPPDVKFTGTKDFSQVYVVIQLLKQKNMDIAAALKRKSRSSDFMRRSGRTSKEHDVFESPGPLHDIIVCWIDQHEVHKGGVKRLQPFVFELIRSGIFYPQAYARQLIISGMIDAVGPVVPIERRKRHHRILKQLPGLFIHDALQEANIIGGSQLLEVVDSFSNERRLLLQELLADNHGNPNNSVLLDLKPNRCFVGASVDFSRTDHASSEALPANRMKRNADIEELKESISSLLQFPGTSSTLTDSAQVYSQGNVKRSKTDLSEGTMGCEDCRRAKRQKLSEEKNSCNQGSPPIPSDDEITWWVKKGSKLSESFIIDPPAKSVKPVPRSRQKTVRKTQSLAQLQAARIEGSQGASTSHICDNKVSCPHHRNGAEGENHKAVDGFKPSRCGDIVSIGKSLKQLRFAEKRSITVWMISVVQKLVEEAENNVVKTGQFNRGVPIEDRSSIRWKLGEDELSSILYLIDISLDLVSAVKFLLWVLPKANSSPNFSVQSGRNLLILPRNKENQACEVREAFLISALRRYENILLAADLILETLSASMTRAAAIMASNGRLSGSPALMFARHLLKRYKYLSTVLEWERNFKTKYDMRLLAELDRSVDGEYGIPLGIDNPDEFLRQKFSSSRLSRVGVSMRDIVQQNVDEAFHYFVNKDRQLLAAGTAKTSPSEKADEGYQIAQQIIIKLMDCIRQTGGAAQEGDPSLVSSAVSAIVNNIGPAIAKLPEFTIGNKSQKHTSSSGSSNMARDILRIHITCLSLLKEALGERQSRVFEVAFATEASSALSGVFAPGKASRNHYQIPPDSYDSSTNLSNEILSSSGKVAYSRATKITAAVSALVIGAITHGVTTLERMINLLRLKENLDFIHFVRTTKTTSNGNSRSGGAIKVENSIEVFAHLFRLLVGNCKTVSDGLVVELLGEPYVAAISRMQRLLPLNLVFPPAYSIFAFVLWKPFVFNSAANEDTHRLYQSLTMAISDVIKHLTFRDVCLRDTQGLYDLVVADSTDAEFASMLELNGLDMHSKSMEFVPLRARLFLNALIDCKMPPSIFSQEKSANAKIQSHGNGSKLLEKIVHLVDTLQPAKFHWQWVELRLLLNEQALVEKIETHDVSLAEAIRTSSPSQEKLAASENENNFIEIILTRLLVRPDAVPLFSELVHLFGRSLEDSVLTQAKWFLAGSDVLFGRKSIKQRLMNIAENKGLPTKVRFWRPWGWCSSGFSPAANKGEKKRKLEITSIEEGEVVEEGKNSTKRSRLLDETSNIGDQLTTERAFIDLLLPCIDQSSDECRSTFANDLIKQLKNIEQQISLVSRGSTKQKGVASSGNETSSNKGGRKGAKGGSPGMPRRSPAVTPETIPPSPVALRASLSLRLQFLLRLLPIICVDGEASGRNIRNTLASIIFRLLCSRIVYEDSTVWSPRMYKSNVSKTENESMAESSSMADLSGENLFERLLFVFHGLLSTHQPCWLKPRTASKQSSEAPKDFAPFDRDIAESFQIELERLQLPDTVRWRIQSAMPNLLPSLRRSLSCQPPSLPTNALSLFQHSFSATGFQPEVPSTTPQRSPMTRTAGAAMQHGKSKQTQLQQQQQQEGDMEIDPWTLLEDATGSGSLNNTSNGDHSNLRAASWLKGTVRVRRTDLTYIGSVDEDS